MRMKGILAAAVLLALGILISFLSIDSWLERGIERAGEGVTGAKVEVDGLDFNLFRLSISWKRLQVADPKNTMSNLLETGRAAFRMHPGALLRKRIVIEEMTLVDVGSGTPREKDGALERQKKPEGEPGAAERMMEKLKEEISGLPVMNIDLESFRRKIDVDSLIAVADLRLPVRLDSAMSDIRNTSQDWQEFHARFQPMDELDRIRDSFSGMSVQEMSAAELLEALANVRKAQETLGALTDTVDHKFRAVKQDYERITAYGRSLENWMEEDYRSILEKARMPDLSMKGLAGSLFGPEIVRQVDRAVSVFRIIRELLPEKKVKPEKQKKPRIEGQDIAFPDRHGWPSFLIRKIELSGFTGAGEDRGYRMEGIAQGITTQRSVYGKPMLIDLKGSRGDQSLIFAGRVAADTSMPDRYEVALSNVHLTSYRPVTAPYCPDWFLDGRANAAVAAEFGHDSVAVRLNAGFEGIRPGDEEKKEGLLTGIVRNVLSDSPLQVRSDILFRNGNLEWSIESNIEEAVSREIRREASEQVLEAQRTIRSRLARNLEEKQPALAQMTAAFEKENLQPVLALQERVSGLNSGLEGKLKEISEYIEKRKDREAEQWKGKALDLLKELRKK